MITIEPATVSSGNVISMLRTLNIHLREIGDDFAVMEVTVDERHLNYLRGAHGGLVATLIDSVSFFPRPLLPSGRLCTTTNLNVTFVRPAQPGDHLVARAQLVHLGRRMASVTAEIRNQDGKIIAHGTTTLMITAHS